MKTSRSLCQLCARSGYWNTEPDCGGWCSSRQKVLDHFVNFAQLQSSVGRSVGRSVASFPSFLPTGSGGVDLLISFFEFALRFLLSFFAVVFLPPLFFLPTGSDGVDLLICLFAILLFCGVDS